MKRLIYEFRPVVNRPNVDRLYSTRDGDFTIHELQIIRSFIDEHIRNVQRDEGLKEGDTCKASGS